MIEGLFICIYYSMLLLKHDDRGLEVSWDSFVIMFLQKWNGYCTALLRIKKTRVPATSDYVLFATYKMHERFNTNILTDSN